MPDASHTPQDSQSTPIGVPYFPQLKPIAGSILGALVICYLETRHPAPQDSSPRRTSLPVEVDFDQMAAELGVGRRTLGLALMQMGRWYSSEVKRLSAARSGREFLANERTQYRKLTFYAYVCPNHFSTPRNKLGTIVVRRNSQHLAQLLQSCGLPDLANRGTVILPRPALEAITSAAVSRSSLPPTLAEILLRNVPLVQDRRATRYSRLRKAQDEGLTALERRIARKKR